MKLGWYEKSKQTVRYWLLARLPNCQQTVAVISQSLERPLTLRERALLKLHLWVCMWCLWYLEHLQLMRTSLRAGGTKAPEIDSDSRPALSPEARERIKRNLANR